MSNCSEFLAELKKLGVAPPSSVLDCDGEPYFVFTVKNGTLAVYFWEDKPPQRCIRIWSQMENGGYHSMLANPYDDISITWAAKDILVLLEIQNR